jgi:uncharacterized protein
VRIAVIGTGISGLATAWLLHRHHEVHVFERDDRVGGHTNTVTVAGSAPCAVDTGFIVYNEPTYPMLTAVRRARRRDRSRRTCRGRCAATPATSSTPATPAASSPSPATSPIPGTCGSSRHRALQPLGTAAGRRPATGRGPDRPLPRGDRVLPRVRPPLPAADGRGHLVDRHRAGARLPARHAAAFFANHGLLGVTHHHPWRTVVGGASSYIPKLSAPYRDRIHRGDGGRRRSRDRDGVTVRTASGPHDRFDRVVLATHADEALGCSTDPSPRRRSCSGRGTTASTTPGCTPTRRCCPRGVPRGRHGTTGSTTAARPEPAVSLSYWMNRLQPLDDPDVTTW